MIVRRDGPITCLEELRGCSWAYNEPASHSGYTVTLYSLVAMGARPGFLGPVVEAGFHQRAIRMVHSGSVDAAAIDSQVLAIELRDHPELGAGLRLIGSFGPSTIQPVVAASRLPHRLKDQVRDLLVGLGDDPTARPLLRLQRAGLPFRPHRHPRPPGPDRRPARLPRPGGRGRLSPAGHPPVHPDR